MTGPLWAAFGIAIGAALLNGTLGLTRPLSRTYVSFAWIMAFVAAYLYLERQIYASTTSVAVVELVRLQAVTGHAIIGGVLAFLPVYTRTRLPAVLVLACWALLAVFFVVNLATPYGVWFAGYPRVIATTLFGEPYSTIVAPPAGVLQYAHAVFVVGVGAIAIVCGVKVIARGQLRRGITISAALGVVILFHVVDIVRDEVGGSWPYLTEFGLVAWGIIMSVQLALDYRQVEDRLRALLSELDARTVELAKAIGVSLRVRDRLNTPLQTLELGLSVYPAVRSETIDDLRAAVRRLTALGRSVESTARVDGAPELEPGGRLEWAYSGPR